MTSRVTMSDVAADILLSEQQLSILAGKTEAQASQLILGEIDRQTDEGILDEDTAIDYYRQMGIELSPAAHISK